MEEIALLKVQFASFGSLPHVVYFHPDIFSASSHGGILLAEAEVDGLDGGEVVEEATGDALADMFQ